MAMRFRDFTLTMESQKENNALGHEMERYRVGGSGFKVARIRGSVSCTLEMRPKLTRSPKAET